MSNFTRLALPTRGSSVFRRLLSAIFLMPAAVFLSAWSFQDGEETVTIKGDNVPLITVFKTIKKQTGYSFFYAADYVNDMAKVSVDVKNTRVEDVLLKVLGGDYVWVYNENAVSITKKKEEVRRSSLAVISDSSVTQITVSGSVVDTKGTPIPGATVMVKGTKDGANTDKNGNFSLPSVAANAVLVISSIGYEKREVPVKGKTILAKLNVSVNDLNETVVVAYGTTTQLANTGAVTVVKGRQIQNLPNRSFDKSLQGLVPGLLVTSGTGQPGGAPANFVLRGIATGGQPTTGQTYRNPLIVIDGVPVFQDPSQVGGSSDGAPVSNPMAQLNPSDIESISVLKDAAAIALYGSKASNGVILVTTKKGKAGKTIFSFRHQTDISSRLTGKEKVLDQQEYLGLLYEAYKNSNPGISDAQIKSDLISKFPYQVSSQGDTSFYPTSNWNDALFDKLATNITNELSMSGGNEKSNFYLNLEYTKQNGIVKNTGYDRKSLRFNYENRPFSWLKIGLSTTLSYNLQNYSNGAEFERVLAISPLNPIRDANHNYIYNYSWGLSESEGTLLPNPVAASELNIKRNTAYRGLSKLYGETKFLKFFTLSSLLGVDFMLNEGKEKVHPLLAISGTLDDKGSIVEQNYRNANVITTNILRFDNEFNNGHNVNLLLGQEAQVLTTKYTYVENINISANPTQDQLAGGTTRTATGNAEKQTLLSYFGQATYGFNRKYFLSGSIRTDGSSRFGKNERFGTYWSTGVGWIASSEAFMESTKSWLDYLKLRSSIGAAGNSAAILSSLRYDPLQLINYSNGLAVLPDRFAFPGNPGIQWEQTFTWDAGLEVRLLKERIALTLDVYNRKTSQLISEVAIPGITGFSTIRSNIGDMTNRGIELSVSADIIRNANIRWNVNVNWSKNRNKFVESFYPFVIISGNLANEVGREYNSFYLPVWAGVNPVNGKPQWIDSAGKISEDYNAARKEFVGKTQPDGFGAISSMFSYKGIEISAMVYYQYGFQIYHYGSLLQNDGLNPYINQSSSALNRWQRPGDNAFNPRRLLNGIAITPSGTDVDQGTQPSTRYLIDGDFVRLSNVVLAYNFPSSVLSRFGLGLLKVYVQGHNLATWTKYTGQDPENVNVLGTGNYLYPQQRSFTVGVNASF